MKVWEIFFVDDRTGEVVGGVQAIWVAGEAIDEIPADGGPIADAIQELAPPGCHAEARKVGR